MNRNRKPTATPIAEINEELFALVRAQAPMIPGFQGIERLERQLVSVAQGDTAYVDFRVAFAVGASISFGWTMDYEADREYREAMCAAGAAAEEWGKTRCLKPRVEVNAGATNRSVATALAQADLYGRVTALAAHILAVMDDRPRPVLVRS